MSAQPSELCRQLADHAMGTCPVPGCGHGWTDHRRSPPGSGYLLLVKDPAATAESVACWVCERACFPSPEAMYAAWLPRSMDTLERVYAALEREGAAL